MRGWGHGRPGKCSANVRERAVRMALGHQDQCDSEWADMC